MFKKYFESELEGYNWQYLLAVGVIGLALFSIAGAVQILSKTQFPEYDDLIFRESVLSSGHQNVKDGKITSIEFELGLFSEHFIYDTKYGDENAVWDALVRSNEEAILLKVGFGRLAIFGRGEGKFRRPVVFLALDGATILSYEESYNGFDRDRAVGLFLWPILIALGLFIIWLANIRYHQENGAPFYRSRYAAPSGIALILAIIGAVAFQQWSDWTNRAYAEAEWAREIGDPVAAISHYSDAVTYGNLKDPEKILVLRSLAYQQLILGRDYEQGDESMIAALETYGDALEIDPNNEDNLISLGNAYMALGAYDGAFDYYQEAQDAAGEEAFWPIIRKAALEIKLGQHQAALVTLDDLAEDDGSYVSMPVNIYRSRALDGLGRLSEAIVAIDTGMESQNDFDLSYIEKGCLLARTGKLQTASETYEKGYDLWKKSRQPLSPLEAEQEGIYISDISRIRDSLSHRDTGDNMDSICRRVRPATRERSPLLTD